MLTQSHSTFANVIFLTLFMALVSPALSTSIFGLGSYSTRAIAQGGDCSRSRNGCRSGLTCIHGGLQPRPFQCHPLHGQGGPCHFEPYWRCQSHLRCALSPGSRYGTCVPPNLPTPKYGFCGFTREHRKCPPGHRCVIKGQIGHCEDPRPPTPTPRPSPSRSPTPSPSLSPAPVHSSPPYTPILSEERKERIRQKIKAAGGCNANVCFAIDGSGSISREEFDVEKAFVLDVVSLLTDNPVEVAAVQFSTSTNLIQPLTPDDEQFVLNVQATNQIPGASFVSGGMNYCVSELNQRRGESNKIVLLSDGRSNIGGSPVRAADAFRSIGGNVCVVGAGNQNEQELLDIVDGDASLYYRVDNFFDFVTLANHIESVTLGVCSLVP